MNKWMEERGCLTRGKSGKRKGKWGERGGVRCSDYQDLCCDEDIEVSWIIGGDFAQDEACCEDCSGPGEGTRDFPGLVFSVSFVRLDVFFFIDMGFFGKGGVGWSSRMRKKCKHLLSYPPGLVRMHHSGYREEDGKGDGCAFIRWMDVEREGDRVAHVCGYGML